MACRKRTIDNEILHWLRQFQQAQRIGDMAATLADHLCQIILCIVVIIDKLLISQRFFDRIQVGALHVFDDRDLKCDTIVDVTNNNWDRIDTGPLRSAPATLTSNQFEPVRLPRCRSHDDRLHHAMFLDRLRRVLQVTFREHTTRIARIARNEFNRNIPFDGNRCLTLFGRAVDFTDQRR